MARIQYDGIEELIESYTFREEAEIKIPKRIRQRAFTLQIDIEIVSVAKETYKNFKSTPANGFYGYATLVQRDYADLIIPIEQPRQRIYYHINDMAHNSWYNLYLFLLWVEERQFFYNDRLSLIEIELGIETENATFQCPVKPIWQETTLREIYVECDKGTQFKIEVSYWQAKPMELGGCVYDGTSGIVDGDKDNGLPASGTQPQVPDDPNNPFGGQEPPSSDASLGDLLLDKLKNIDKQNEDNEPIEERGIYGFRIFWTSKCNPTGNPVDYVQPQYPFDFRQTDRISFTPAQPPNICNGENELIARNVRTGERYTIDAGGVGFWTDGGAAPSVFTELVDDPANYIILPKFTPPNP